MKTFCVGYLSSGLLNRISTCSSLQGIISLPVLLLLLLFFQAIPLSAGGTNSTSDDLYGEHEHGNLDPSIGVVIVVLVCAFFMTGCIATYIGGCAGAGAVAVPSYSRFLLPVVSGSHQGCRRGIAGLDKSEIELFPTFVYSDVKKLKIEGILAFYKQEDQLLLQFYHSLSYSNSKSALECAVCLAEFKDDETLRLLPKCEHAFHPQCIDPWLSVRSSCPLCRSDLVPIAAEIRAGGNELTPRSVRSIEGGDESDVSDDEETIPPGGEGEEMAAKPNLNLAAKFVRSNSTGHSLIISDRFRLRLPEDVRRQILVEANMRRAKSFGTLPRVPSSRKGYRSGGEGSNSRSGRLLRWTGLAKSENGEMAGTSSDAVAVVVN